jgi:hypothetical protein
MSRRPAVQEKPFDALQTLLATARDLAKVLTDDPQLERLVRAFRMFPEADRAAILQVLEKDAAWRSIVEKTDDATGITVRPNPHASLYVHILEQTGGTPIGEPEPSPRDADVIRRGVETFVQMLPLLFQDAVRAQWLAAGRDLAHTSGADLRGLALRLAKDVEALIADAERTPPTER